MDARNWFIGPVLLWHTSVKTDVNIRKYKYGYQIENIGHSATITYIGNITNCNECTLVSINILPCHCWYAVFIYGYNIYLYSSFMCNYANICKYV